MMTRGRILIFSALAPIFLALPAGSKTKPPESVPFDEHALEMMLKHPDAENEAPEPAPMKLSEPHPPPSAVPSPPVGEGTPQEEIRPLSHRERVPTRSASGGEARTYKVYIWQENGDTLWRIAQKMYGDKEKWPLIYNANRDILQDPNKIYPRQVLKIPSLNEGQ